MLASTIIAKFGSYCGRPDQSAVALRATALTTHLEPLFRQKQLLRLYGLADLDFNGGGATKYPDWVDHCVRQSLHTHGALDGAVGE